MQRLPRYQLLLREYQKNSNLMYGDMREVGEALRAITSVTLGVNESKRDHDELHMREMLERNSTMEVLDTHNFEALTFSALRNCAECEKAIWGFSKSGVRCAECGNSFHTHCSKHVLGQRKCPRRKKLDFSLKKLTYLQEVLVIPYNPDLHVATPTISGINPEHFASPTLQKREESLNQSGLRRVMPKPVNRSKAVLCFFDDGLGIAHIRSDETGADKFDFMGDLPWGILDECFIVHHKEREDEFKFAVKARFQEWRFALPTKTEQEAIVSKLNEARKVGAGTRKRSTSIANVTLIRKQPE
jgi:hypothetical protein